MRILLSVEHPAWSHQFKYLIRVLEGRGHIVKVVAIKKDCDTELLDAFNIKYQIISNTSGKNVIDKGIIFLWTLLSIFKVSLEFRPDIYIGRASPMMAINSFLFRKKHVVFEDSEPSMFCLNVSRFCSSVIITPLHFNKELGRKHVRVDAYKETFYLHPNLFKPDPTVLAEAGLLPKDKFIILRFVSWNAHHDIGQHGFDLATKKKLVEELGKYARVLITSESRLPQEFEEYLITTSPEKIHDLLYYATLLVSDSQTMTTEAGILGTPAIRCNTFVGPGDMGNFIELEQKYGLIYCFREPEKAIQKALVLLQQPDLKEQWAVKRQTFLADKIDINSLMVNFIEDYPETFNKYSKKNT